MRLLFEKVLIMFLKSNTISINELFSLCFCVHDEQPGSLDRTVVTFCILLWVEFQNFEKWGLKIRLYKLANKCFPQAVTYAAERSTFVVIFSFCMQKQFSNFILYNISIYGWDIRHVTILYKNVPHDCSNYVNKQRLIHLNQW